MEGLLAIVSHPDDETFGCGGTLALHASRGDSVQVICLTNDSVVRSMEFNDACRELGLNKPLLFDEKEITFNKKIIKEISDIIVSEKPRIIITHVHFDYHLDHKLCYEIVKESIEWAAHTTTYDKPWLIENLLLMEVNTLIPTPQVLVDISNVIEKKQNAIKKYSSQLAKFNWDYYEKYNIKKAELRGIQANCNYAEAFIEEKITKNSPFYSSKNSKYLL